MTPAGGRLGRAGAGLVLALAAAVLAVSAAPADPPSPWKNAPERFVLATGLPCLYQKDTASPTTVVGLFIGGGKSAVPQGLDGLAAISTRILLEIPDEGKVQDLMSQATRLSYVCFEDTSVVIIECLTEHLEDALRVSSKIIQDPLISGLRVGRAKETMRAYGKMEEDDAVTTGRNTAFAAFFGGRGCGSVLYGTEATLEAIGRKDLTGFVKRYLVKPNVFFGVQTDLDPEPIRRLLERFFDGIPGGQAPDALRQDPVLPENRDVTVTKDTKQSFVGRAYALPRAGLADMARGILLETLLGKDPGSRLWSLRVDDRLAYSVDADVTWMKTSGLLIAHLETDRTRAAQAAAALERRIEGLRSEGIPEEEMAAARTVARNRFLRETEAKAPRLRMLGLFEGLGLGPGSVAELFSAFEAVGREEMEAYVRDALDPSRALRITVGPAPEAPTAR